MNRSKKEIDIINKAMCLIIDFEGFRSNAYTCPGGKKTIGYGETDVKKDHIEKVEAQNMLRERVISIYGYLKEFYKDKAYISTNQYVALISFCYNLGMGNFIKSTLKKKIDEHAPIEKIKYEFNRWIHVGTKVLPGLIKRRAKEAETFAEKYE